MSITVQQRRDLAAKAGIAEQYLYQCLSGRRAMSPQVAMRVEGASGGLVSRRQLRADWAEVWPELKAEPAPKPVKAAKRKAPVELEG